MLPPLLEIQNLTIQFTQYTHRFHQASFTAINDLNLTLFPGKLTAVIGSSGSGKSLLAHAILHLLPYNASWKGKIFYNGSLLTKQRIQSLRGQEIALVPQSITYLDPLMPIGQQLFIGHRDPQHLTALIQSLHRYGLDPQILHSYPFELSGGMARRILIASAVMMQPKLILADEPTPGLDETTARQVLGHFRELADEGTGVLLITHDLETALSVADQVVILYAGTALEQANAVDFSSEQTLRHPYTRALWRAMPSNGFQPLEGVQPPVQEDLKGCPFAPRCLQKKPACLKQIPWQSVRGGWVRCIDPNQEVLP